MFYVRTSINLLEIIEYSTLVERMESLFSPRGISRHIHDFGLRRKLRNSEKIMEIFGNITKCEKYRENNNFSFVMTPDEIANRCVVSHCSYLFFSLYFIFKYFLKSVPTKHMK